MEESFTAKVQMAGINPYVDVPGHVVEVLGNGTDDWFRTTLVSLKSKPTRLYLDTWMRETASVGVDDLVLVIRKLDPDSREIQLPGPLLTALEGNAHARAAWETLAPSRRREILSYLNFLKTPEALECNVRKTIAKLIE